MPLQGRLETCESVTASKGRSTTPSSIVRDRQPSRPAITPKLEAWTKHEVEYASNEWRKIFRGVAREKNDHELTDADIAGEQPVSCSATRRQTR